MKSGFIAIVGRPNVGKSTLLNAILGEKIAITSDKPQTTRNTIRGIYTEDDTQIIFLDTPGIHKPKTKLGNYMTDTAMGTFNEVDGVIFIVDSQLKEAGGDRFIFEKLKEVKTPKLLMINKIDLIPPEQFQQIYNTYDQLGVFDKIFGVSALKGTNVEEIINQAKSYMKPGPHYFPDDIVTDHPERFIVTEIIREKALNYLEDEVPHGIAVDIESYEEGETLTKIGAIIYCERNSHKGIIIGKEGKKLKGIGKSARIEIENLLGTKVFLEIWVKVRENWRDSGSALGSFGYRKQ